MQAYEPLAEQVRVLATEADVSVALAIMNQARIKSSPLTAVQVIHLLSIGYRAGLTSCAKIMGAA